MNIILGPPGTGKTTTLLDLVEQHKGARVGYLAFTRQAANEARQRTKTDSKKDQFRTIHSMCFSLLGMMRSGIFGNEDRRQLGNQLGVGLVKPKFDFSLDVVEEPGVRGWALLQVHDLARIRQVPLKQQFDESSIEGITLAEVEWFRKAYDAYRTEYGVSDFTDLLEDYIRSGPGPSIDVLFVDEAQDLSRLQWRVIDRFIKQASIRKVYVAGDDDQAIFRWAGADVDHFLNLKGKVQVLHQSYRVPKAVHSIALSVLKRIDERREKDWSPRDHPGSVDTLLSYEDLPLHEGQWLILARDNYTLNGIAEFLRREGFLYIREFQPAINPKAMGAIYAWERIRANKSNKGDRKLANEFITPKRRIKVNGRPWYEALDRIPSQDVEFIRAARRHGDTTSNPRIRLSTIHSAKGAQADNVALFMDVSAKAQANQEAYPDDELRTLYVGVTRAKERLYLIEPKTRNYFEL